MFDQSQAPPEHDRAEAALATAAGKPADPGWAWAPYKPDTQRPWNLARAGHLYRRAAFGAGWDQLQQALADGPRRTIDKLLRPEQDVAAFNRLYDEYEASASGSGSAETLRAWWLRRMIHTPHPLLEKMTLFWHGHLATSNAKVKNALLMHRHVQLLRSHALGHFERLLQAVSRDPAMLIWLDCQANRKAQPSEGYARALMDTFAVGLGHFTESDVREAARAFTGWFVLRSRLRYIPREHDSGVKKILGQEGNFDDRRVVQIVLEQPAAPRLLIRKLYGWLISETEGKKGTGPIYRDGPKGAPHKLDLSPFSALIAPLAESFAKDYDVAKLVETMLRSNLFFSAAAYRRRIKCPVEFALGIIKGLEAMIPTAPLGRDLAALGQNLYHPPTVKGWPGGRHWINRATLLGRSNLARALLAGSEPYGEKLNPLTVAQKHGHSDAESAGRFLFELFLQGDIEAKVRENLLKGAGTAGGTPSQRVRRLAHAVVTLPEFQLA